MRTRPWSMLIPALVAASLLPPAHAGPPPLGLERTIDGTGGALAAAGISFFPPSGPDDAREDARESAPRVAGARAPDGPARAPIARGGTRWVHHGPTGSSVGALAPAHWDPDRAYALRGGLHRLDNTPWGWEWFDVGLDADAFTIDPRRPGTIYGARNEGGAFKSIDGGDSWFAIGLGLPAPLRIRRFVFHPTDPAVVFAIDGDDGPYVSFDEGASFTARNAGLPDGALLDDYRALVIDPLDTETLYLSNNAHGVYKSEDGGLSWTRKNAGLPIFEGTEYAGFVRALAMDPATPTTLYAGVTAGDPGGSAYKSVNGGESWFRMVGVPRANANAIAVDPHDPNVIYVGLLRNIFDPRDSGLYKSTDGGATWAQSALCSGAIQTIELDASTTPAGVYVAEAPNQGARLSADAGVSFEDLNGDVRQVRIGAVAIAPSDPNVAYAGGFSLLARSDDGGVSWVQTRFCDADMSDIVVDPFDPDIAYASVYGDRVYKSTNGGDDWILSNAGMAFDARVLALAIDPRDPQTLYAAAANELYKSTNGGASWAPSSAGIQNLFILDVAVAPSDPLTLYAGTLNGGVFKSLTGGLSWFPANAGLPLPTELRDVAAFGLSVHPTDPAIAYVSANTAGTYETTTGGGAWFRVDSTPAPYTTAIDPSNPSTVYTVGTFGVRVSTNGGSTWQPMNTGLEIAFAEAFAIGPSGTRLLAGTPASVARWENPVAVGDPGPGGGVGHASFHGIHPAVLTSGAARFDFEIPRAGVVSFDVLDAGSRVVARIDPRPFHAGASGLRWDARGRSGAVASGVYLVRMTLDGRLTGARKLVVAR